MITCQLIDPKQYGTKYHSLSQAVRDHLQGCIDVPENRSPVVIMKDGKIVLTIIPQPLSVQFVFADSIAQWRYGRGRDVDKFFADPPRRKILASFA